MPRRSSRRNALAAITGTAALLPVLGQQPPSSPSPTPSSSRTGAAAPAGSETASLSKAEFELLTDLTERVIPKTDTPGAAEAGVPTILQSGLAQNPARLKRWQSALAWFAANGGPTAATRLQMLERISRETGTEGASHFELLKGDTIDIYYSTQAGLQTELGWNANTYLAEFKGCTHPEHKD
jgi:hypothetical protein